MLIFRLLNYLSGYFLVSCPGEYAVEVVNLIVKNEIDYWEMTRNEDGSLRFYILEREYKKLKKISGEIEFEKELNLGLPQFVRRYRKRIGIPVGVLIFIILIKLSTMYVWDVTVTGNSTVSDAEITDSLEKLGCSVGTYIPSVDFYNICHEFLLENENISWVSVNMVGTTAKVEVIERGIKGETGNNGTPSNLVAKRDGIIVRYQTASGETAVKVGQTVSEGELLVSGVVMTGQDNDGFTVVRSQGEVYAQTERAFYVEVPLDTVEKVYTGKKTVAKSLKFFGKTIKLKEKYSILPDGCDIIEEKERLILFEGGKLTGGIALPMSIITEYYDEYEETPVRYTENEALEIATAEMSEMFSAELTDAEILRLEKNSSVTDGVLVLEWKTVCIENIAKEVPIGLE